MAIDVTGSRGTRAKALAKLAELSRGNRSAAKASIHELFPYGLFAFEPRNPAYDRDVVISAVAGLEQVLEEAILKKFGLREDADRLLFLDQPALLRDLFDKTRMAYLLGIIGPLTMRDMSIIRQVRNAFAHTRGHLDLDMPEFQEALGHLTAPDRWPMIMDGHTNQDSRERLIQTCFQLSMYLAVGTDKEEPGNIMANRRHAFRQ